MNVLRLLKIEHPSPNRLQFRYEAEGAWAKYLRADNELWVEYDEPVDAVPDSVAAVPFVGNFIVLGSLIDGEIQLE